MGISREEALDCYRSDDLIGLGMEADAVRRKLHPEDVVTYAVAARINYNGPEEAIETSVNNIIQTNGATAVLEGAVQSHQTITWFERFFDSIKGRFPALTLIELAASETIAIKNLSGLTLHDTITRLRDAGLGSISGDETPIPTQDWIAVHSTAHRLGLPTIANLPSGSDQTLEDRMGHLMAIRQLQEETGGFIAFDAQLTARKELEQPTAVERLKSLAISRIFLDNIANIQCVPESLGLKELQVCLRFGGNDIGTLLPNNAAATEEHVRRIIRDAGFHPVERDALYRTMFLN